VQQAGRGARPLARFAARAARVRRHLHRHPITHGKWTCCVCV
jgi:hypothetical protein